MNGPTTTTLQITGTNYIIRELCSTDFVLEDICKVIRVGKWGLFVLDSEDTILFTANTIDEIVEFYNNKNHPIWASIKRFISGQV